MRHIGAIAGRELRSYFASPTAYAVLALFALLSGFFFIGQVISFDQYMQYAQQTGQAELLEQMNLNDWLIGGYFDVHWIFLLFLVPGLTMSLFSSEKQNHTDELLFTSPISIWEVVLGKYLAAAAMVSLLVLIVALLTSITFVFGDPEPLQTLAGLLGVWLIGLAYAAFGTFASSITPNALIAFLLSFFALLILAMVGFFVDVGAGSSGGGVADALRWVSSQRHFNELTQGEVKTEALAHFAFMIAAALLLAKTSLDSVRWR